MNKPVLTKFETFAVNTLQLYDSYLPNAFDESLTILQKMNKLIEYLNRMGLLMNDVVAQWNEVMEWVMNDGLTDAVSDKLDQMVEDGTLASIINDKILKNKAEQKDVDNIYINVNTRDVFSGGDVTEKMKKLVDANKGQTLWFPYTVDSYVLNTLKIEHPLRIMGNTSKITTNIPDKRVIEVSHPTELVEDVTVENMGIHQFGNHTTNNDSSIKFKGTINAKALTNTMRGVDVGVSTAYGEITALDRLARYNLVAFNFIQDIKRMGIENIGSAYNVMIGNRINGNGSLSHGIRSTGYGTNDGEIGTESKGHTGVANIIHGMQTGFSLQNTAKLNTFTGNNIENLSHAVVHMLKGTVKENHPRLNKFGMNTFKDVEHIVYNQGGALNSFDFTGEKVRNEFILEETNLEALGFNDYKIKAKDVAKGGTLRHPDNHIDIDLYNVTGRALTLSTNAKRTTGRLKVNGCDNAIGIFSDDNNLNIVVSNAAQVNAKSITVSGDNNVLDVYTDGDVDIVGQNNTIRGVVKGNINVIGSSASNNFSQVAGYSKRQTLFDKQTDVNGRITIPNTLKTGSLTVLATEYGSHGYNVKVYTVNKTDMVFEVRDAQGNLAVNTPVTFSYTAESRTL